MNSQSERARRSNQFRALLFFVLAATGTGYSQTPAQPLAATSAPTISVDVRLVVLHASVRDKHGALVSGLQKDQFHINEDGKPQTITLFRNEDIPVSVGVVIDNSGSMSRKRVEAAKAVAAFARSSNPVDEMFLVNFNEKVRFGMQDTELRSASAPQLEAALLSVPSRGMTALYDAISGALSHLRQSSKERKALIVISDGGDNASRQTIAEVLRAASLSQALIYTIDLSDEDDPDRNPRVLKKLASATGGEAFRADSPASLVPICERIAVDLRTQYTMAYSPTNASLDGSYRKIRVKLSGAYTSDMHVRVRTGYLALPEASGEDTPKISGRGEAGAR